jgi:hypothetical protein
VSTALLVAYMGAAVTTMVVVLAGGTRHTGAALIPYAVLAAVISLRAPTRATPAIAVTAWLFYDGFITGRHAHLTWHGAADARGAAILLVAAAAVGMLSARARLAAAQPTESPRQRSQPRPSHRSRPEDRNRPRSVSS